MLMIYSYMKKMILAKHFMMWKKAIKWHIIKSTNMRKFYQLLFARIGKCIVLPEIDNDERTTKTVISTGTISKKGTKFAEHAEKKIETNTKQKTKCDKGNFRIR